MDQGRHFGLPLRDWEKWCKAIANQNWEQHRRSREGGNLDVTYKAGKANAESLRVHYGQQTQGRHLYWGYFKPAAKGMAS
jgi:hypothetical protein